MTRILCDTSLINLIASGAILNTQGTAHIQPASLDLRLSSVGYRVCASFLTGKSTTVNQRLKDLSMHTFDLDNGAVLEKGGVYIIPLQESLSLPSSIKGRANPKSSTGRLDIFARVLTDEGETFDDIPYGYQGRLYLEVSPRTFSVRLYTGTCLTQLRLMDDGAFSLGFLEEPTHESLLPFSVDVTGQSNPWNLYSGASGENKGWPPLIGWRARKHAGLIDVKKIGFYPILEYWEPVFARTSGGIILDPDDFYILATAETLSVPEKQAAEMLAYNPSMGEFRVHYAGFFDPGFGLSHAGGTGSRGVLEVRTHEVPFFIAQGQIVGHLHYLDLDASPEKLYGQNGTSNYQGQGLKLAKQFQSEIMALSL